MIDKNEAMLTAIDVVTAWTDNEDNTDFVSERVGEYLAGPDDGITLTVGLVNLFGVLLMNLAKVRGASGDGMTEEQREILRELALRTSRRSDQA
jgi:hypothetical protein